MASKRVKDLAVIGYSAFGEPLVDSLFSQFAGNLGMSDDLIKLGAGYFLRKQRGVVGDVAQAMFVLQLYKLGKSITGGGLNLLGVGASNDGW